MSYRELRLYDIPKDLLKEGENTISIRVEDIGDNGGIYDGPVAIVPSRLVSKFTRKRSFWK